MEECKHVFTPCTQKIVPKDARSGGLTDGLPIDPAVDFGTRATSSGRLWAAGQQISLGFVGGTSDETYYTRILIDELQPLVGVEFIWLETNLYAPMIRIGFDQSQGCWSYIGTDNLLIYKNDITMNFGWVQWALDNDDMDEARRVVHHEMLHMLGMEHEQNHPDHPIQWDLNALYKYHSESSSWTWETVQEVYTHRVERHWPHSPYDKESIMHYPVDQAYTLNDYEVPYKYVLSPGDKQFLKNAYG